MKIRKITKPARRIFKLRYCGAVIVAAGKASRMEGVDKIMAPVDGEPVIRRTVRNFQQCDAIKEIVVVTRPELIVPIMDLCHDFSKLKAVVVGGEDRMASVHMGLNALSDKAELAAIQDGARPFTSWELIDRTVRAAQIFGAAAPAVPVKDTVKLVRGGFVRATPDRETLRAVQTPQVFDFDMIRGAMAQARAKSLKVTDDCSVAEQLGMEVRIIPGEERNIKITTPMDLALAQILAKEEA